MAIILSLVITPDYLDEKLETESLNQVQKQDRKKVVIRKIRKRMTYQEK